MGRCSRRSQAFIISFYSSFGNAGVSGAPQQAQQAPSRIVVRNQGLGMAVGSRSHLENEALAKRSWYRNFLMRGFHLLVLSVAGGAIRDTQCGFKVSFPIACLLFLIIFWSSPSPAVPSGTYSAASHLQPSWCSVLQSRHAERGHLPATQPATCNT